MCETPPQNTRRTETRARPSLPLRGCGHKKRARSPANAFSDPVMTIAPISLSASIKRRASFSSAISAMLSALSALGLLSVTSATRDAGRDVIMFSYFASKADAVVDIGMDMDLNVDVVNWDGVNRDGLVRVGLRGEEKKTVAARATSWRRKTDMMW